MTYCLTCSAAVTDPDAHAGHELVEGATCTVASGEGGVTGAYTTTGGAGGSVAVVGGTNDPEVYARAWRRHGTDAFVRGLVWGWATAALVGMIVLAVTS